MQYPNKWLVQFCQISEAKAHKLLYNKQKSLPLKDLGTICEHLNTTPNGILYWDNEYHNKLQPTHPMLMEMSRPEKDTNWYSLLKHLSKDEVADVQQIVIDKIKNKNKAAKKDLPTEPH